MLQRDGWRGEEMVGSASNFLLGLGGCQGYSCWMIVDTCGNAPLGWVATKTLPAGCTHEETSMNMPRLSGGRNAS